MEEAGERFDAFLCLFDLHMHDLKNTMRPIGEMGECLWTLQNTETLDPVIISLISPFYTLAQGRLGLGQHLRIIHAILHGDLASAERALKDILHSVKTSVPSRLDAATVLPGLEILLALFESANRRKMLSLPLKQQETPFVR